MLKNVWINRRHGPYIKKGEKATDGRLKIEQAHLLQSRLQGDLQEVFAP